MRTALLTLLALVALKVGLVAQREYTAIPPAAAQVLAALPRAESVDEIQQHYVATPLPLKDGVETILVEGRGTGPCGAANCQAYILEKQGGTYRILLNARAVQQTHVLNSVTNGYHNIQTDRHGSATQSDLFVYHYNGKEYRLVECLSREYAVDYDDKSEEHVSEMPEIKKVACSR